MTTELADNALMDEKQFYAFYSQVDSSFCEDGGSRDEYVRLLINAMSNIFEQFCNRKLKARGYSYIVGETEKGYAYDPEYSIFDGPDGFRLYLPTYPVNSLTTLLITDVTVTASTNYEAVDGYILYNRKGLIYFEQGFDFGYFKNVKVKWNGGYLDGTPELSELQYLMFTAMKSAINAPQNPLLQSETIGSYQYQLSSAFNVNTMRGFAPEVFANLGRYRREAIG